MLHYLATEQWHETCPESVQTHAINNLEKGEILYFPQLTFSLTPNEQQFLSPEYADPDTKNISYHTEHKSLKGVQNLSDIQQNQMKAMLDRFACYSQSLIQSTIPSYSPLLILGRTSYRPVQIHGRKSSCRKDDTRLHIDAFPSSPNHGKRILRVFSNINPHGEERVWRVGEPFEQVAERFLPQIKTPFPGSASLLHWLRITKSYRTAYDHYMLNMHHRMKTDDHYQKNAPQQEIRFPPNCSWIVQTDDVSHAAMSGQYVLEQTFYLPINAMQNESKSPLRILESLLHRQLI